MTADQRQPEPQPADWLNAALRRRRDEHQQALAARLGFGSAEDNEGDDQPPDDAA